MNILQALFSFDGRMRRRDWWLWTIALVVVQMLLVEIGMRLMGATSMPFTLGGSASAFDEDRWMLQHFAVQSAVWLALAWPALAVGTKRLHDRGHRGRALVLLWALALIEPALAEAGRVTSDGTSGLLRLSALLLLAAEAFIGLWLLVLLGALDGDKDANRFGPSPKQEPAALPSAVVAE
jgi:uncharacterized membrane protein YhaH (DUF805 family)